MPATTGGATASVAAAAAASPSTASTATATAAAIPDKSVHNATSPSGHIASHKPPSQKQQRPVDGTNVSINPADDTPPRDGRANLQNIGAHTIFVGPEARGIAAAAAAAALGHKHDDATSQKPPNQETTSVRRNQELLKSPFKDKKKGTMIAGKRIAIRYGIIPSLNLSQRQKDVLPGPKAYPSSAWVFGKIISGTSTTSYIVKMDAPFPSDDDTIELVGRKSPADVKAIDQSFEERPFDKAKYDEEQLRLQQLGISNDDDDDDDSSTKPKKRNWQQESADAFDKLAKEVRAKATEYECKWGKDDDAIVVWDI